jgi:hypothetical protein
MQKHCFSQGAVQASSRYAVVFLPLSMVRLFDLKGDVPSPNGHTVELVSPLICWTGLAGWPKASTDCPLTIWRES